jgi:hypothetical protein
VELTDLEKLPGAVDKNFEALTRTVVARRYGRLGTMRERRNQPGVEFYLRVEYPGPLGDPGRVWGWSCKWFTLNSKNEFTSAQRKLIEDSVDMAAKHVNGLTDFVLCLPHRPAKKDEEWVDSLGPSRRFSTKLWSTENFETELVGYDELRSTFFGELTLTPDVLASAHERSVAPVSGRWVPPLHTSNHVEERLDRILMDPASFGPLTRYADAIAARAGALRAALAEIDGSARAAAEDVAGDLDQFVAGLREIVDAARDLRPAAVRDLAAAQQPPATSPRKLRHLTLQLRKQRLPAALHVGGLSAEIRDAIWWLEDFQADIRAPMIAVVAAAGQGKTHLAAQLTAPASRPSAGVFIQGGHLRAGGTLDDLARRVPGLKTSRFEDLLDALNSAGARAGARLPLVIDGLNEAEKPAEWRALLDELIPALRIYPNVLLVITLREPLAAHAVPQSAEAIQLEWRQSEVAVLVQAYFQEYKISPGDAWLPTGVFSNPLFLRMYCEAANPDREEQVGAEALPTSLVGVFELYRDAVTSRLAGDPARVHVPADQIRRRLSALAWEMWTRGTRRLPSDDARSILDDSAANWDESLFRRLLEEGVLLRDESSSGDDTETGVLFDRFAGYLIADALLVRLSYAEADERLAEPGLWNSLLGEASHPLGEDVAVNLIGLLPRRFAGHHLWRIAPAEHRPWALAQELLSESHFLDDSTVDELAKLVASWGRADPGPAGYGRIHPLDRLWEIRATPAHRLNASFLDRVLRLQPLPERDRRWTEWARSRAGSSILPELKRAAAQWSETPARTEADDLAALAIAWLLTSTSRELRDLATKALQRYGRPEPRRLFDLAARMLDVDDPYVVERVVAAAFGAASARQMPDPGGSFEQALAGWLAELRRRFLRLGTTPTTHALLRDYVRAIFEFAGALHPAAVPPGIDPAALEFEAMLAPVAMADDDPDAEECCSTFGMDFENYVVGSAIEGRRNYDYDHPGFRQARGEILARVWSLGWRAGLLGAVDRDIADDAGRFGRSRGRVERYGKKYGWIAYYELVGRLADSGRQRDPRAAGSGRTVTPDIDPTFPDEPPPAPFPLPAWAEGGSADSVEWLRHGAVHVPAELWSPEEINGVAGGWLLAEGFLEHRRGGRQVFGFFRTLLLEVADVDPALKLIRDQQYPGNDFFPPLPEFRGIFAGEIPWSSRFKVRFDDDDPNAYAHRALRASWDDDKGIGFTQLAVGLSGGGDGATSLERSYDVPSYEFAAHCGLRQLPGSLDLVSLDGVRASATFRVDSPWNGHLLFLRRDLVTGFAGDRRIVQVAWGERNEAAEWHDVPDWAREVYQDYAHIWREVRLPGNVVGTEPP